MGRMKIRSTLQRSFDAVVVLLGLQKEIRLGWDCTIRGL